jgi:DNA-directed RNA polymerase specialized sigma24 family protein
MKDVLQFKSHWVSTNAKNLYATPEDFEQLFAKQKIELLRLSLQLTANAAKAEMCLILAMRDCLFRSTVSKDRVRTWARRMVIRNAIHLVWGTPNELADESGFEFQLQPSCLPLEALQDSVEILTLPNLDRLAFVICVLERYSILDCALLVGKSPREVYDAMARAKRHLLPVKLRSHDQAAAELGSMYGYHRGQATELNGSCGSIFDRLLHRSTDDAAG